MPPLYPPIEPFRVQMLDTGHRHQIYVEECGNPNGLPVVVLHGGPGGGCSPAMRRYFDPTVYRIILFDQRGCGRSRPYASIKNNTTWDLLDDIELIRQTLGIDRWIVFGGSWGATLALIYAQTHPACVRALILRGVFLMTKAELDWFYGGGAGRFWPDVWERFVSLIPENERGDMIQAYHRRLFSGNLREEMRFGQAWAGWENALASIQSNGHAIGPMGEYARAFSRLECHYFVNGGFLDYDGQILAQMDRIAHIPGTIVQGRYDMICPPQRAYQLAQSWPRARLYIVRDAGHALSEPPIRAKLIETMDRIATNDTHFA